MEKNLFTIEYNRKLNKLTIYNNGKVLGGMIGRIAHERFAAIRQEIAKVDVLNANSYGYKSKKKKV